MRVGNDAMRLRLAFMSSLTLGLHQNLDLETVWSRWFSMVNGISPDLRILWQSHEPSLMVQQDPDKGNESNGFSALQKMLLVKLRSMHDLPDRTRGQVWGTINISRTVA
eukprot:3602922-Amphidinium_carterae.1